eukprot:COSAG01_NODE_9504_length_2429_cov_1.733906_3_plen_94_part_00
MAPFQLILLHSPSAYDSFCPPVRSEREIICATTGGNQPRGTRVVGNVVREFGVWQKQSSAWAQQLTADTWIEGNVMFNSPRAAVNFVSRPVEG